MKLTPAPDFDERSLLALASVLRDSGDSEYEAQLLKINAFAVTYFDSWTNMAMACLKLIKDRGLLPEPPLLASSQEEEAEPDFIDFLEERQD